jgi:hypothetical protein
VPNSEHKRIVGATWSRRLPGFQILAFDDHSYLLSIGAHNKVALLTLGWHRWHPNFIEFERWGLGPWPS